MAGSFPLDCKISAGEGCNELLPRNQGRHKVVRIGNTTLCIAQKGPENTVSVHRATLAPASGQYWNKHEKMRKDSSEDTSRSKNHLEDIYQNNEDMNDVNRVVWNGRSRL